MQVLWYDATVRSLYPGAYYLSIDDDVYWLNWGPDHDAAGQMVWCPMSGACTLGHTACPLV